MTESDRTITWGSYASAARDLMCSDRGCPISVEYGIAHAKGVGGCKWPAPEDETCPTCVQGQVPQSPGQPGDGPAPCPDCAPPEYL